MNGVRRTLPCGSFSRLHGRILAWTALDRTCSSCLLWNTRSRRRALNTDSTTSSSEKPFYITTPIFYPNAAPHIGHLYSLVTADIFARHARLTNPRREVRFVTGTDEHGMKIQKAAKEKGVSEKELCDELSQSFEKLSQSANISYTRFMRTSSDEHKRGVVHLWNELFKRGYIYKDMHRGWYSVTDECFYTDNQVKMRVDPKTGEACKVAIETKNAVEWTEETNWKFKLSSFREELRGHFSLDKGTIYPPHQHDKVIRMLPPTPTVDFGNLSISRPSSRIKWGVRVPGDDSQTIYVWLDALTVYLTGVGFPWESLSEGERCGWPADLQIIGKDILKFHAIYFPAFLLALDIPLPRTLISHQHWTANQKKMSKSLGNVVDPFVEMETHGVDVVRWYLMRVGGRFITDSDWSSKQLLKHRVELQNLGNFYLRISSVKIAARLPPSHQHVPLDRAILLKQEIRNANIDSEATITGSENAIGNNAGQLDELRASLTELTKTVDAHLQKLEVADALEPIIACLNIANKIFTTHQPWDPTTPASTALEVVTWSREALRICAILLQPFIPGKAEELLDALRVGKENRVWADAEVGKGEEFLGEEEKERAAMRRVVLFENERTSEDKGVVNAELSAPAVPSSSALPDI